MENQFKTYLIKRCQKLILSNGNQSLLSLESFFCDQSINIEKFAELTNWWLNEQKLEYYTPANTLLNQLYDYSNSEAELSYA